MLTSKQRAFLRSQAMEIDTTFQIGKGGVSENMLLSIEAALASKELVKLKCLENCIYTPREACDGICTALEAEGVQCIGSKFVLFKISPEHRRYDLDRLCIIEKKKKEPLSSGKGTAGKKPDAGQTRSKTGRKNRTDALRKSESGIPPKRGTGASGENKVKTSPAKRSYTVSKKSR